MNPLVMQAKALRLQKRFSQHFLVDEVTLQAIADSLDLEASDTVLEIGPGGGFLTEKLLATGARVIAVELDRRMTAHLSQRFAGQDRLTLIQADILGFDFAASTDLPQHFKLAGNLPYAITGKILHMLAGDLGDSAYPLRKRISRLTLMTQREVAERLCATPGNRAYNALSVAMQFYYELRIVRHVSAELFYPPPRVDSAIISLAPLPMPAVDVADPARFAALVRAAFSQKRKTVRNALLNSSFASAAILDRIFKETGIDGGLRAEALSLADFGVLSHAFGAIAGQD